MLRTVLLLPVVLLACATAEEYKDPAVRKEECLRSGGEWGRFGVQDHLNAVYSCVPRTQDGGKPCRNHADCEYLCISKKEARIGTEMTGECAALKTSFGCNTHVDSGQVVGRVCVD